MDYFERRRQEFYNKQYNSNDYIDDIIIENYNDYGYEFTSEGFGDMVDSLKEKMNNAINKIKEIWAKFKAWIKNLFNVIINMFKSGKRLVDEHESDIRELYNKKRNAIKYNGHTFTLKNIGGITKLVNGLDNLGAEVFASGLKDGIKHDIDNYKNSDNKNLEARDFEKELIDELSDGKASNKEELLKIVSERVKSREKKEYKLGDIDINDIIDVAGNGKEVIKNLKEMEKNVNKFFNNCISVIKDAKSDYSEDKDAIKFIDTTIKGVKAGNAIIVACLKRLISDVKEGNRAYTALIRRILDGRIKGSDDDEADEPKADEPKADEPKADEAKGRRKGGKHTPIYNNKRDLPRFVGEERQKMTRKAPFNK